jgi:hypothetical protein
MPEQIPVTAMLRQHSGWEDADWSRRLVDLTQAVGRTASRIGPDTGYLGLVRAIFVAPEYFFAAPRGGSTQTDATSGVTRDVQRGLSNADHARITQALIKLSETHPRVLIVPGTIAWWEPVDVAQMQATIRNYARIIERLNQARFGGQHWQTFMFRIVAGEIMRAPAGTLHHRNVAPPGAAPVSIEAVKRAWERDTLTWLRMLDAAMPGLRTQFGSARDLADLWTGVSVNNSIQFLLRNTAYALLNGKIMYRYDKRGDFHETKGYGADLAFARGDQSCVTTIEGLRVGFEICLDHNINALPALIRPGVQLDLHIVCSDYVENRKTSDNLLKEGGHKIHAATHAAEHGVWVKQGGTLVAVPVERKETKAGGGTLYHYTVAIEDESSLEGVNLFDEPTPTRSRSNAFSGGRPPGSQPPNRPPPPIPGRAWVSATPTKK